MILTNQKRELTDAKKAFKSLRFWHMSFMLYSGLFFGVYVAAVYKSIASGIPNEIGDKALTLTGAIGSVMNGSSRVIWASFQDKFGFKAIYMTLLAI